MGKEDALADPSKYQGTDWQTVLPGFFETMRTPLIAGRTFTDADNAPWPQGCGRRSDARVEGIPARIGYREAHLDSHQTPEPEWVEIIGVVAHERANSLAEPEHEQIYFTDGFRNYGAVGRWILRTSGDPAALAPRFARRLGKLDPNLLIDEMHPMSVWVDHAQAGTRFSLLLIGVLGVIGALFAGVRLYGVLSTFVRQRTAEIGVRMALGAAPVNIFTLVVGHGLRLSAMGIGIGIVAAVALTRVMITMLVGVKPTDAITFLAIAALFFAIAVISCWIPARRAAGLAPTIALRE